MADSTKAFCEGEAAWEDMEGPTNSFGSESFADFIKVRRIPNQNIVHRLRQRETHAAFPGTNWHIARSFHQNLFPNFTIVNVEKPPCFLRKFSPDGKHFIAFSSDQTSIEIYKFRGSHAAENILFSREGELLSGTDASNDAAQIRACLFDTFFELMHTTSVAPNGEHLNRECSLFTEDSRYVIVGSAMYVPEEPYPYFFDMYQNNESVAPNPRSPLEDYSLHIVDMHTGRLCDTKQFKCDKIFLSHNQGLYLYRNILAVLSVQQQTVHIFHIGEDGYFVGVRSIGRFCYEDDELMLSHVRQEFNPTQQQVRPFRETAINCLKHRLLVFLYSRAKQDGSPFALRQFFQYFDQFCMLRMWKMQLLDENHLLIKYASEDVVTLRVQDPNSQPSFFVVYDMMSTNVVAVFENTSEELLELFENFCDLFRNASLHSQPVHFTCSASSNIYARQIQRRFKHTIIHAKYGGQTEAVKLLEFKHTIIHAKYGGQTEAVKRLLAQLPISAQSYSSSPYLDLSLFSYDDKWVSVMERPKACGDHPIRFYARDSGLLKFKIQAGMPGRQTPPTARRLVAFTFHPYEPFAISVQRTNAEYVVNFHVRHCPSD